MSRHCHVIYSDDVRQEVGGKVSYMGVYGPALEVQSFPQKLPKLCVSCIITASAGDSFNEMIVEVFLVTDTERKTLARVGEGDIDLGIFVQNLDPTAILQAVALIEIGGIAFDGPCRIETIATINKEPFDGQSLLVRSPNQAKSEPVAAL